MESEHTPEHPLPARLPTPALAPLMDKLEDLLARVEAATGPDRKLDFYLWAEFMGADYPGTLNWDGRGVAPFTASLDAALALVERVLPDTHWAVGTVPAAGFLDMLPGTFSASVGDWANRLYGNGHTPALALLAAMLKALIALQAQEGK